MSLKALSFKSIHKSSPFCPSIPQEGANHKEAQNHHEDLQSLIPRSRQLQALFRERGFHDYEVAAALGTSPQCLSRRIRGAAPWPSDEVAAICKIVGIPQEQIGYYFFPEVAKEASA